MILYLRNASPYRVRVNGVAHRRAIWQKASMTFLLPSGERLALDHVAHVGERGGPLVSIDDCRLATATKLPASPLTLQKKATRAQHLLDALAELPGATTKELAARVKVPSNVVSRALLHLRVQKKVRSNELRVVGDRWTVRRQWWKKGDHREPWHQQANAA